MTTLQKLAAEYRPSMDIEIVHSWAKDVVEALTDKAASKAVVPTTADGWVSHGGGPCPVDPSAQVWIEAIFKEDGAAYERNVPDTAEWFESLGWWDGSCSRIHIIAYRLAQ